MFWFKISLLTLLVLQNTLSALLGRYTRSHAVPAAELYSISDFILVSELLKLVVSLLLEAGLQKQGLMVFFQRHLFQKKRPQEMFLMAIPALLYYCSNTLLFVAISILTVPLFQVSYQFKFVVTSIVSVSTLGRRYSERQWTCLGVISVSVALLAWEENDAAGATLIQEQETNNLLMTGFKAIVTACLLSALAGVYLEKILQTTTHKAQRHQDGPSLWMHHIQLAFVSVLVAATQTIIMQDNKKPFLHGFTPWVWCQVVLFAGGGLLVSAMIKYADSVMKGLATGMSVLLSTAASSVFYGTPISPLLGATVVVTAGAVFFFSNPHGVAIRGKHTRLGLVLFVMMTMASVNMYASLLPDMPNAPIMEEYFKPPKETESFLIKADETAPPTAQPTQAPSQPPPFKPNISLHELEEVLRTTDLLFDNFTTSTAALEELRKVQKECPETASLSPPPHEAVHVLYDLRERLGNRPVKYLEIGGSYPGISAVMMLRHKWPTMATLVDPYAHNEATIRKNLRDRLPQNKGCGTNRPWELFVGDIPPWDLLDGDIPAAIPVGQTFDIILINSGGISNTKTGVWANYNLTVDLLRPGGFMLMDGYLDSLNNPDVRAAVNEIAQSTDLVPIGALPNVHGIHPRINRPFINEYIFQKPGNFTFSLQTDPALQDPQPVICVSVVSYRRPDGSTPALLENIWKMLERQSYTNWELYLTGDYYDNETEWKSFSFYNDSRVNMYNLPEPGERGKLEGQDLAYNTGYTAMNNAIDRVLADGKEWVAHLDDVDMWDSDHLQNVANGIRTGATFIVTHCQFVKDILPKVQHSNITHEFAPAPCQMIQSSMSFNVAKIKSRYKPFPGTPNDAAMWSRIIFDAGFYPAFIPVMSCHHFRDGAGRHYPPIVRKSVLQGVDPPPGWYGAQNEDAYHALAANEFPNTTDLSVSCQYVIGPEMPPADDPSGFARLAPDKVPYYIRVIEAFAGLPVWEKLSK